MAVTTDGLVKTAERIREGNDDSPVGAVKITTAGSSQAGFSEGGLFLAGNLVHQNPGLGMNDFLIRYSDDPGYKMAVGESAGNMLVEGTMSENEASTGVAFVDDAAVYEKKGADAGYELAYVNFSDGVTRADGGNEFYIKDHLGSTRAIMIENGGSGDWLLNGAMAYLAYGAIKHLDNVPETGRKKFTGKEFDEEGGIDLNYFGARYYDSEIGLWCAVDPAAQHFNKYLYGSNNPINRSDPDGKADVIVHSNGQESIVTHDMFGQILVASIRTAGQFLPGLDNVLELRMI